MLCFYYEILMCLWSSRTPALCASNTSVLSESVFVTLTALSLTMISLWMYCSSFCSTFSQYLLIVSEHGRWENTPTCKWFHPLLCQTCTLKQFPTTWLVDLQEFYSFLTKTMSYWLCLFYVWIYWSLKYWWKILKIHLESRKAVFTDNLFSEWYNLLDDFQTMNDNFMFLFLKKFLCRILTLGCDTF